MQVVVILVGLSAWAAALIVMILLICTEEDGDE